MPFHGARLDALAFPLLLLAWSARGPLRRSAWPALAAIAVFGVGLARIAIGNIRHPHEWDYACFWLYGHVAAAHLDVYDPRVFSGFALPFVPSDDFVAAVLRVGFPYPPPAIALFYPLGFIDGLSTGLALWYAVQCAALGGAAWLLARTLLRAEGLPAVALIVALVVTLPATAANVDNAQTNFVMLLAIALTLAFRDSSAGAVWPALAMWVKPFGAALLLPDLCRLRGRRLGVAAATIAVSLAAATALLGPRAMLSYVRSNPAGREPGFTFSEPVNQSLLAVLLRARHAAAAHVAPTHETAYLALAALFLAVTVALCARAPRGSMPAYALALQTGLLIYPAALTSYAVVTVVPLLVLWHGRARFPGRAATVVAIAAAVALLQGWAGSSFAANLVLWLATAVALARESPAEEAAAGRAADRSIGAAAT